MELVRQLAMDGILYMPGPDIVTDTIDLSKGASLNRVLRKIYPRGTEPKVTDLVAFFDDDQVGQYCLLGQHCLSAFAFGGCLWTPVKGKVLTCGKPRVTDLLLPSSMKARLLYWSCLSALPVCQHCLQTCLLDVAFWHPSQARYHTHGSEPKIADLVTCFCDDQVRQHCLSAHHRPSALPSKVASYLFDTSTGPDYLKTFVHAFQHTTLPDAADQI